MLLDVVEVARSHTGLHLAQAFADVLKEFGIDTKVSIYVLHTNATVTYEHGG